MAAAEAAGKVPVRPRIVEVEVGIRRARVVPDPLIVRVDVRHVWVSGTCPAATAWPPPDGRAWVAAGSGANAGVPTTIDTARRVVAMFMQLPLSRYPGTSGPTANC